MNTGSLSIDTDLAARATSSTTSSGIAGSIGESGAFSPMLTNISGPETMNRDEFLGINPKPGTRDYTRKVECD